jgi:predicted nucleic acid-binding protein
VRVLVDTSIWSLALRRQTSKLSALEIDKKKKLTDLVSDARTMIIGPIRQELLSGVRERTQFERLRELLRPFIDEPLTTENYERAAEMSNQCVAAGLATTAVDMLICAAAVHAGAAVFTSDRDFAAYSKVLPVRLFAPV